MVSRRPIAVAIKQRAANAAVQHARKRQVMRLRFPLGNNFIAFYKALDSKALVVARAAAKTLIVRCVLVLEALHSRSLNSRLHIDKIRIVVRV